MITSTEQAERRASLVIIAAALVAFGVVLLLVPSFFESYDEAKYLGIAGNMWAGMGPLTVFGQAFLPHAPGWPVIIGAPHALAGIDPLAVGHALNALSGIAVIAMASWFGWRIRPFAGALTAGTLLAFIYLLSQTRTARLDVPAAALGMAYLIVGLAATRRGSARWGIAAGLVFAVGFLVKEINLPLFPVPIVAAILARRPWRGIGLSMGSTLAVAALGIAPWMWYFATQVHEVYRLGVSDKWLVPIGVVVAAIAALGIASPWIAARPAGRAIDERVGRMVSRDRSRALIAWGFVLVWVAAQASGYVSTVRLAGHPIIDIGQLRLYIRAWSIWMSPITAFCAVGTLAALGLLWRRRGTPAAEPLRELLIAFVCAAPLVLLVVEVGEPPRNYIAVIALLVALAAGGWLALLEELAARTSWMAVGAWIGVGIAASVAIALPLHVGVARGVALGGGLGVGAAIVVTAVRRAGRERWLTLLPLTAAVVMLTGGTVVLGASAWISRAPAGGAARAAARSTIDGWIRANVPAGSTVAFGNFLSQESAYALVGTYRLRQITARIAITDPKAPEGLILTGEPAGADWIAADTAPRNVNEFQAFRASWLVHSFTTSGATYWVYPTGVSTSAGTIEAALVRATGFQRVAEWTFPVSGSTPLHVSIYRVDPQQVAFDAAHLSITPAALNRLITLLGRNPTASQPAAKRLLDAVVVEPAGAAADAATARLRTLAGQ